MKSEQCHAHRPGGQAGAARGFAVRAAGRLARARPAVGREAAPEEVTLSRRLPFGFRCTVKGEGPGDRMLEIVAGGPVPEGADRKTETARRRVPGGQRP